jgi:hypothetical protein
MIEDLGEIDVDGARLETALARLEWVWGLIVRRGEQLETEADAQGVPRYTARFTGPAFVVHARNVPALVDDRRAASSCSASRRTAAIPAWWQSCTAAWRRFRRRSPPCRAS